MRKWSFPGILITVTLLLTLAYPAFPVEAKGIAQMDEKACPQQASPANESASIEIANLSCQELSSLGSAVSEVLNEERKSGQIRKVVLARTQQLAGEAEDVGELFSGFTGFFRKFLASLGWIKVQPPENVITLSIDSEATILAIGAVAGQWLQSLGPTGKIGAAIVTVLTPGAKWLGKELAIKDALGDIGYFTVTKPGIGTMDVIYDKESQEASVNVHLEDLKEEWKAEYGWENEHIYMHVPFDEEPPKIRKTAGRFDYRVVFKGETIRAPLLAVPFFSQRDGRWSGDKLGIDGPSIHSKGCALTSATMVMAYYGVDTDPGWLNRLIEEQGYTKDYLLQWRLVAAQCFTEQNKIEFVGLLDGEWQSLKQRLDEELAKAHPVIAWVTSSRVPTHFIVFRGKVEDKYHFFDPADESINDRIWPDGYHGKYKLLGLRVYHGASRPLVPPHPAPAPEPAPSPPPKPALIPSPAPEEQQTSSMRTQLLFVTNPRFQSIKDLDGALIIGEQTDGPLDWIAWANIALKASGVSARFGWSPSEDYIKCLQRGAWDALLVTKHPWAPLNELIASGQGRFLPWSKEGIETVTRTFQDKLISSTLPANTYKGQKEPVSGYEPKTASATKSLSISGRVTFVSDRDGNAEIYVMNADGSNQTRLTHNNAMDSLPAWSPDGKHIAFTSNRDGNDEIYVMNADGSNQTRLTHNNAIDVSPAWSPDGKKIAFSSGTMRYREIYVMNADGSNPTQLTLAAPIRMLGAPAWSPDGKQIAFSFFIKYSSMHIGTNSQIYIMNADGSNQTSLTTGDTDDDYPSWSPDGKKIAFTLGGYQYPEIHVMNADGSNPTQLTLAAPIRMLGAPAWSPDGKHVAFTSNRDGNLEIYIMNADGSNQTRLTYNDAYDGAPAWSPR